MEYIEKKICQNAKAIREKRDKTQKEIAEQLGISLSAYQKLEQGSRTFSTKQLYCLANLYDINIDFFFSDAPKYWNCFSEEALIYDSEHLTEKSKKDLLLHVLSGLNIDVKPKDVSALVNWLRTYKFQYFYSSPILKLYTMKRNELLEMIRTFDKSVIQFLPEDEKKLYVMQDEFRKIQQEIEQAEKRCYELHDKEQLYEQRLKNSNELIEETIQDKKTIAAKDIDAIDIYMTDEEIKEHLTKKAKRELSRLNKTISRLERELSSLEVKIEEQNTIISQNEHIISSLGNNNDNNTSEKYIELSIYEQLVSEHENMKHELDVAYENLDDAEAEVEDNNLIIQQQNKKIKDLEKQITELEQDQIEYRDDVLLGGYSIVDINMMEMSLWRYYKEFGPLQNKQALRRFAESIKTLSEDIPDVTRITQILAKDIDKNTYKDDIKSTKKHTGTDVNLANTPYSS